MVFGLVEGGRRDYFLGIGIGAHEEEYRLLLIACGGWPVGLVQLVFLPEEVAEGHFGCIVSSRWKTEMEIEIE